ncbi:MAG: restriction endonuclease subunit S [Bacteroidales bacterium]
MMEVKVGYKKTEVGVIPEDWYVILLEDLASKIGSGITPTGGETVYKTDGRPFVRSQNIGWGRLLLDDIAFIDDEIHQTFPNTEIRLNDVFLNISGASIGRSSYADQRLVGGNVNQHVCIIRTINESLNPVYLNLFLLSKNGQKQIDSFQSGGNRQGLNIGQIKTFQIPIPNRIEQTAIATTLSDTDALINSLEKLIAKKRNIKQGAMQNLLQPKDGWEVKKLGEIIINFQNGYGFSAIGYVKSGIPIITMAQIGLDGSFNLDEKKVNYWNPSDFSALKNFHIKDGDLIIAMTDVTPEKNLIGRMAIVQSKQTLLLNQRVGLLRLDASKVNAYLLKTLSNMRSWRTYCIGSASLGVQANIGTKDILNGEIMLPKIDEQNNIATVLSDMDAEIAALETKLEKYRNIKLGMMQNLLTGKIRLV